LIGRAGEQENGHLTGYLAFDLVFGFNWRWGNYDYGLQLNLKNITDERYFSGGNTWADPLNSQLTLKVSF